MEVKKFVRIRILFLLYKLVIRRFISLVFIISFTSLLFSCGFNRVLGLTKEDFKNKVAQKDYDFIKEVDYLKNSIKEINRLGDGASYYMSFVYKESGMRLFSNKLLYQEILNKDPYFGPKATNQLLKQLLQEKDFVKAELHARNYFEIYKEDNPHIRKQLIEALYWQRKDDLVIPYIDNLDRTKFSDYANNELDLLKCVSSARLNKEDWESQYRDIFFNQPLSPLLSRAYSFIDVYPDYGEKFSKGEKQYFEALSLASKGDYYNSQRLLRSLLYNESSIFSTIQSVKNISKIVKNSRVVTANLNAFNTARKRAPESTASQALVSYASLYFNINRHSAVVSLLEGKIDSIPLGMTRDDAIWLYILSLSHSATDRVVANLKYYVDKLSGEDYPSDIIDHVVTSLVQNEEWEYILDLEDTAKKYAKIPVRSRISWILTRLYFYGFLDSNNSENEINNRLDAIVTNDSYSYYSYIANALLKRESNLMLSEPLPAEKLEKDDEWIQGFIKYGLEDEALSFSKQVKEINYTVAIELAHLLDKSDKHLETLRFLNQAKVPLNTESFPLYYPLPYKEKIVEVANTYNFPHVLYSGLIRTESGFDMNVVSVAGAIGLSQLMPDTAKEQAYNIGISNPDLNDPNTNITLGGSYLNWLISKYGTLPLSFMAYNAGPGNVWKWQRGWGELPDELFIEAAPFKETRAYVPKILRAAIYYGHEEFDISPYQVVKQIFPHIDKS